MKAMVTMAAILATTMLVHAQDSDAKRMQSEEMNPGSTLGSRERTGDGTFKILIYAFPSKSIIKKAPFFFPV